MIRSASVGVLRLVSGSLFLVRGDSMSPALRDGDLIHVRPKPGKGASYERGSVVVAETYSPQGESGLATNVKRVVGLPGELVRVGGDGAVWIEEEPLAESYLPPEAPAASGPDLSWLCDDDEYFLMGDNREDSWDSRRIGPVPAGQIMGEVWFKAPTHHLLGRKTRGRSRPSS